MSQENKGGGVSGLIPGAIIGFLWKGGISGALWGALIGGLIAPLVIVLMVFAYLVIVNLLSAPPKVRVQFQPRVEVPEEKTSEELWDEQFDAYLATQGKKREDVHT